MYLRLAWSMAVATFLALTCLGCWSGRRGVACREPACTGNGECHFAPPIRAKGPYGHYSNWTYGGMMANPAAVAADDLLGGHLRADALEQRFPGMSECDYIRLIEHLQRAVENREDGWLDGLIPGSRWGSPREPSQAALETTWAVEISVDVLDLPVALLRKFRPEGAPKVPERTLHVTRMWPLAGSKEDFLREVAESGALHWRPSKIRLRDGGSARLALGWIQAHTPRRGYTGRDAKPSETWDGLRLIVTAQRGKSMDTGVVTVRAVAGSSEFAEDVPPESYAGFGSIGCLAYGGLTEPATLAVGRDEKFWTSHFDIPSVAGHTMDILVCARIVEVQPGR